MCRLVAYLGTPILVEEILTKPNNSLIHQSYDALESEMTVNGDGFGLGWYNKEIREEPALFRSINPAWNDPNLHYNASFIQSNCFLAHIRAATHGAVSIENTHPFHYREFLMMHNGGIPQFDRIKKRLIDALNEESFNWITGQTDTQYFFALMMTYMEDLDEQTPIVDRLLDAFRRASGRVEAEKIKFHIEEASLYNVVISNGRWLFATRYSSHPEKETRTLYFTEKLSTYTHKGVLHVIEPHDARTAVLVSSEKLNHAPVWKEVIQNQAVFIQSDLTITHHLL
jgi:glutamine amidotransferase